MVDQNEECGDKYRRKDTKRDNALATEEKLWINSNPETLIN